MIIDPQKVETLIAEIAAEEIASRFGMLADHDIDTKTGPGDFVTAADKAAEAKLEKALIGLYPGAGFIGEEIVSEKPALIEHLDHERGAFWIVDPLDGTRNFVEGRKEFGTIVALVENGETRMGWIYAIPDEICAVGSLGDGVTWGDAPVRRHDSDRERLAGYGGLNSIAPKWREPVLRALKTDFETERARCSAYAYINMVRGDRDFAVYSRVHPWDHAAGVLMLDEVGGRTAYLDTQEPYAPRMTVGRPLLIAGNPSIWDRVSAAIRS